MTDDALAQAEAEARAFLEAHLMSPTPLPAEGIRALLMPRKADWFTLFGVSGPQAQRGYEGLWVQPPWPGPRPGQTELKIAACSGQAFAEGAERARTFPGAWKRIGEQLEPDPIWIRWRTVVPGERLGMSWDGLVQVEPGRWVWCPKPWKVL